MNLTKEQALTVVKGRQKEAELEGQELFAQALKIAIECMEKQIYWDKFNNERDF